MANETSMTEAREAYQAKREADYQAKREATKLVDPFELDFDHMELWNDVCRTDPAHTKQVNTRGGFTSICAQWQKEQATKVFGPYGFGWGVKDVRYEIIYNNEIEMGSTVPSMKPHQAVMTGTLFAFYKDKEIEFDIGTSVKYGDDWFKKGQTDMLTKGLSYLGFSADVFMGRFDDDKYVNEMRVEFGNLPVDESWKN